MSSSQARANLLFKGHRACRSLRSLFCCRAFDDTTLFTSKGPNSVGCYTTRIIPIVFHSRSSIVFLFISSLRLQQRYSRTTSRSSSTSTWTPTFSTGGTGSDKNTGSTPSSHPSSSSIAIFPGNNIPPLQSNAMTFQKVIMLHQLLHTPCLQRNSPPEPSKLLSCNTQSSNIRFIFLFCPSPDIDFCPLLHRKQCPGIKLNGIVNQRTFIKIHQISLIRWKHIRNPGRG